MATKNFYVCTKNWITMLVGNFYWKFLGWKTCDLESSHNNSDVTYYGKIQAISQGGLTFGFF